MAVSASERVLSKSNEEHVKKIVGRDRWGIYEKSLTKSKLTTQEVRIRFIIESMFKAMDKYDESWWLSDDLAKVAYYQMNERVLLISFTRLKKAVSFVMGRNVYAEEPSNLLKYKEEINSIIKKING